MIPLNLLQIFEYHFSNNWSMVHCGEKLSKPYSLTAGVRQGGGPLALPIFCIYKDPIIKIITSGEGCQFGLTGVNIILYANDILLLAPSITALQALLSVCEDELLSVYMMINSKKNPIVFVSVIRL